MADGQLITIEGIEGVGKSTVMHHLTNTLQQQGFTVTATREPGGTTIAEKIRHLLLTKTEEEPITPHSELLLMFAARAQHIAQVIQPALKMGNIVLSDRFTDASFAYQGGGRAIDMAIIEQLQQFVQGRLAINMTLLLDAPPEISLKRAAKQGQFDRIESEQINFFQRVREVYLHRAEMAPHRFCIIDSTQPLAAVCAEASQQVIQRLTIKAAQQ